MVPIVALFAMVITGAGSAWAIDPREAIGAPAGTDFLQIFITRYQADNYYASGNKTNKTVSMTSNAQTLRYGHFWGVGENMNVMLAAMAGIQEMNIHGSITNNVSQSASGMIDPTFLIVFWPYADFQTKNRLALSLWITPPWGDYDNKRLVNPGTNVWTNRAEAAWIKGWENFYLQLAGDCYFYTDNHNYGPTGQTLQRDNLYTLEVHPSYNVTPTLWLGMSGYYASGGQSKVEQTGKYNNDRQNDWTIGLAAGYRVDRNIGLLLSTKYKAQTNNGLDTAEVVRFKMNYFW